jgi:hypothetical protein
MKKIMDRDCDCLVVGAGISGVCAAIAAARSGAKTILIEMHKFPGGSAVTGLLSFICGLYPNSKNVPKNTLNPGIVRQICRILCVLEPKKQPTAMGKVFVLPFSKKSLVLALESLMRKTKNLKVCYSAKFVGLKTCCREIIKVKVKGQQGVSVIFPRAVIDCSGKGEVIAFSRARYAISPDNKLQMASYAFRLKGLKDADDSLCFKVAYSLTKAVAQKKMPGYLRFTTFTLEDSKRQGICRLNIASGKKGLSLCAVRKQVRRVHKYLSENLASFRDSRLADQSYEIAEREGLRGIGDYILTRDDILGERKFKNAAAKGAWPIEFWSRGKGPVYKYLRPGAYYEIPASCLKSKNIKNLFFAGRCISATPQALASARVMGTCMSLGEKAGLIAARYLKIKSRT